ncbi:unnamed protein product [Closterium sp. NIES-65]|nr:unnamed protein product [Closterium sp. NIES-65]
MGLGLPRFRFSRSLDGLWLVILPCASGPFPPLACVEGRGAWVNTDTLPRPSPVAVQVPTGMGGRQHCSSLQLVPRGRVSGWAGLSRLKVGALEQGRDSGVQPLTHLLLFPFSLPSQQHTPGPQRSLSLP